MQCKQCLYKFLTSNLTIPAFREHAQLDTMNLFYKIIMHEVIHEHYIGYIRTVK